MAALVAYIRAETERDVPLVPGSWDLIAEDDRWSTIWPLGRTAHPRVWFSARMVLRHPSLSQRALFVCTGRRAILDHLAARIDADALSWTRVWLTLGELRDDPSAIAAAIRDAWPDERPRDAEGQPTGTLVAHLRRMDGAQDESGEAA